MGSAALRRSVRVNGLAEAGLIASLLAVAAGAWALSAERMAGMDAGPGTELGGLGWFTVIWVTMMAAMMLPAVAPAALAYGRIRDEDRHGGGSARGAIALFVAGYLAVWSAVGVLGYLVIEGARSLDPGFLAWEEGGRYVVGGVILAAAIYELSPFKDACLRRCRRPESLLLRREGEGLVGSMRTGLDYGAVCVGCCWALMAALFALGVMSIAWMALVGTLIVAERLLPWRSLASRTIALGLVVLGLAVAASPEDVPALTIPGEMHAMGEMQGDDMHSGGEMQSGGRHGGGMHGAGEMHRGAD